MSRGRAPVVALLSGAALASAFPGLDLTPFAWIAIAPLLAIVRGRSAASGFRLGFLFGLGFFDATLAFAHLLLHDLQAHHGVMTSPTERTRAEPLRIMRWSSIGRRDIDE